MRQCRLLQQSTVTGSCIHSKPAFLSSQGSKSEMSDVSLQGSKTLSVPAQWGSGEGLLPGGRRLSPHHVSTCQKRIGHLSEDCDSPWEDSTVIPTLTHLLTPLHWVLSHMQLGGAPSSWSVAVLLSWAVTAEQFCPLPGSFPAPRSECNGSHGYRSHGNHEGTRGNQTPKKGF